MGSGNSCDEELTAIRVGPSICHGEQSRLLMCKLKGFILKLSSIDGLTSPACLAAEHGSDISVLMIAVKVSVMSPLRTKVMSAVLLKTPGVLLWLLCTPALLSAAYIACWHVPPLQITKDSTTHVPFLLEKSPPWIMNPLMIL